VTTGLPNRHPHVEQFLDFVRPWAPAYEKSVFSFVAIRREKELVIIAARLSLCTAKHGSVGKALNTEHLTAAAVSVDGRTESLIKLIDDALACRPLNVGDYQLALVPDGTSGHSAFHDHTSSPTRGWRRSEPVETLRLGGARKWDLLNDRLASLEREIQPHGYRSLDEVMVDFGFNLSISDVVTLELVAMPTLSIGAASKLEGRRATVNVCLANALKTGDVSLTLVDAQPSLPSFRQSLSGRDLQWKSTGRDHVATCVVELPTNAVVMCRAMYAGSLHDEQVLEDAAALPNIRRNIVELADPGLKRLRGPLTAPKSDQERDQFESGIAVLLYMLGFDVVRVGGVKKLAEAADIFAKTPSGYVLVVECTTEILDPKGKVGKLLGRLARAKEVLASLGNSLKPERVVGAMMVPKIRHELGADVLVAEQRGVILLCRAEIEQALERTKFRPDADLVLEGWLRLGLLGVLTHGLSGIDHNI
jgi:hypothetical protein